MRQIPREIWVLLAANVVIALGYGFIAPALPSFARSFDVGIGAASVIISAFAVMRLVFAPVGGQLVRRLGERRIYLTGLLIVAASTLACAFAQSYWQLLVFRALGGIGSTMFTVSALGLLIRLAPSDIRGRVSGFFSAGFLIGNITGPLIGSALVGAGLRMPFIVYAAALLVATAVVATQLRGVGGRPVADVEAEPAIGFRAALHDRTYRAILASSLTQGWVSMGVRVALVPQLIVDQLHRGAAWAGVVLAIYAAGNVLAIAAAGRLSDRVGRKPLMLPGLVLAAASTLVLGYSTTIWVAAVLTFVGGVGSGLFAPTHQAALADVLAGRGGNGPRRQGGTALAAFQMSSDVGAVSGPIVAGFVAGRFGFGPAFVLTGLVAVIAVILWVFAAETAPARVGIGEEKVTRP
ncbi:MFS transporter [Williamsia sterculiae]|uniref:Predicted arabinose efflux permease, MFS family n=1 Tax=Williamsia sterculiae TaxID=1344003 RepID=A0A1N7DMT1_9NOCA|nr:MFS transporter [Williamsia sterculiae]SIR77134.1 Predicted arabinose efflux permease, MFS family [Williamsia sterculiae]